jgi:tRNA 2-thiouridine synthesizing protein A
MSEPQLIDLDLSGLKCPLPALRTRKALKGAAYGAVLSIVCTDPMAAIDIPNLVRETGDELVSQDEAAGKLRFAIRKRAAA